MTPPRHRETDVVHAAGAVLWRARGSDGSAEIALVHRPKYDDWSFPKGKLDAGESHEEAAQREVLEETGCRGHLDRELTAISYVDGKGRPKTVRYWSMQLVDQDPFIPNDEVDDVRWFTVDEAQRRLTYGHDVDVLESFVSQSES